MTALFVDHLTAIDAAILCPRRGLVGESWMADIVLEGPLDEQGMVMDFSHVKKRIKQAIDEWVDHTLIVPTRMKQLEMEEKGGQHLLRLTDATGQQLVHEAPRAAVSLIDAEEITCESLGAYLEARLPEVVSDSVEQVKVTLRHEEIPGAYYHYTHGLKKHDGHCQRIAHGHRSAIEIYKDGERDAQLEQGWADAWKAIYLATEEDVQSRPKKGGKEYLRFAYTSREGSFALELEKSRCVLMPLDTTVEHIACFIAATTAQKRPGHHFKVKAFEGIHKGAIAEIKN